MSTIIENTRTVWARVTLNTRHPKTVHLVVADFMPLFGGIAHASEDKMSKGDIKVLENTFPDVVVYPEDYTAPIGYKRNIPCSMEEASELIAPRKVPLPNYIWIQKDHLDDPCRDWLLYEDEKEAWILHVDGDPQDIYKANDLTVKSKYPDR